MLGLVEELQEDGQSVLGSARDLVGACTPSAERESEPC